MGPYGIPHSSSNAGHGCITNDTFIANPSLMAGYEQRLDTAIDGGRRVVLVTGNPRTGDHGSAATQPPNTMNAAVNPERISATTDRSRRLPASRSATKRSRTSHVWSKYSSRVNSDRRSMQNQAS